MRSSGDPFDFPTSRDCGQVLRFRQEARVGSGKDTRRMGSAPLHAVRLDREEERKYSSSGALTSDGSAVLVTIDRG